MQRICWAFRLAGLFSMVATACGAEPNLSAAYGDPGRHCLATLRGPAGTTPTGYSLMCPWWEDRRTCQDDRYWEDYCQRQACREATPRCWETPRPTPCPCCDDPAIPGLISGSGAPS
ncbi:MAG: hypothetical protein ABSG68_09300, partial [Thermoguttaceae bacterium]